ncbi:uncharacterized protein LOC130697990 [Daphnia carinata]|uniref:uncharacterized protein LOC130697990 n=1 Tax=Daphnia carinata TaxID=120202 RepID=UPI00257E2DD9|nr:uncharacterized protein LOC130697990 [Daphnia carinata]
MKIIVVLFMVMLCVGPSLCVWGKLKSKSTDTTNTPTLERMGAERRVGKPVEDKDYDADEGAGSIELDGIESTIINGTDQEERFYNKFPLHVFMKKKRPFVSFSTVTQTSTVIALITSSTVGLCAKLVNVTGPCRLRRGLWEEDPIVLSFEDDMDSIDEALSPSKIFSIETTAMPEDVSRSDVDANTNRNKRISVRSGALIQSSKDDGESRDDDDGNEGRFGFFGLKKKFKKKIKFITVITTTVVTSTSTSTSYFTKSTKTFFIQLCTPSPFPFVICNGRKKRQAELEELSRASNQNS